ncbi:hypothetical protein NQX30_00205 [Candidatus Persebacteraceae bacterium Df01]|uniref:Uncharacterized protein n=1 Tax=Candidatus Doriopsillibacter californiensis TaxID=2970740 RepID=A0ABT7QJA1_9GAMM|nr:hypothetical protein [Candidatus Persebacteraceae bacterium Df01]
MNNIASSFRFIIFFGCAIVNYSCFAQNVSDEKQGVNAGIKIDSAPNMPALFFTAEQRRILEAIRQGAVAEESLQLDEFIPLILVEEIFSTVNEAPEQGRTEDIRVNAFIYNNNKKQAVLWLNGESYTSQEQNDFFSRENISEVSVLKSGTGEIVGIDHANNSKFVVKVGQKLSSDGGVDETYPVILVKKK